MDWTQVIVILGTNLAMFLWSRAESRSDHRMAISMIQAIQQEIKDFHGRLYSIEEKNRKKQ